MADPVGPVFTGGFEEFVVNDENGEQYTILYLPDRNNDLLQRQGKAPVYYWAPGHIRLARFGDTGDFKFRHIHFVGVLDEDMHVGVEGRSEVVGGLLSFTTTSRYPTAVLQKAEQQLLRKFRGDDDRYWGWRSRAAPMFRIAPIRSNITAITNLAPGADGTAPAENIPTTSQGAAGGGPPGAPRSMVGRADLSRKVIHGRSAGISNLDAWAWQLQGQGPGSVTGGENAYAGLIGSLPSELIWAGFRGGASPIVAAQHLQLPVWSQEIWIKITGNWDRIFQHFSGHVNANYLWFSGDIKAEFNQLRINGDIQVQMAIDGTLPGADKMNDAIDKRIDLILERFMDQATKRIFEPAPPEVEPASAPSGGLFSRLFGGGLRFALKYRRDETRLNLNYEETRYFRYLQPTTISSSFEGFYNTIKNDPDAERKYFIRHVLGDLNLKVARIVKPVVNWPDPSKNWIGEPVAFLSTQIGYPKANGSIQWTRRVFQSTDTSAESNWNPVFVRRELEDVANPPAGWKPDITYVRRKLHLTEPSGVTDNPFVRVFVEKNEIELDPAGGTPTNDNILEVRADSVGKLEVGPIDIDVTLQDNTQVVTVEFRALGKTHKSKDRPVVKFQWNYDDQEESRFWEIFTGQENYTPLFQYRVIVNVKGSLFSAGMTWSGPWENGNGNGPLMVHVPKPDEDGVVSRKRSPREEALGNGSDTDNDSTPPPPSLTPPTPPTPPVGDEDSSDSGTPGPPPALTGDRKEADAKEASIAGYDLTDDKDVVPPPGKREERSEKTARQPEKENDSDDLELLSGDKGWVPL